MRDYIINENLLCFTQDTNDKNKILVVEKSKNVTFNGNSLSFLKKCCFCYGHSYNIQRQFVIDHFNYYIKTPIILSEYNKIILFPTASPESDNCIWVSYNNVERYYLIFPNLAFLLLFLHIQQILFDILKPLVFYNLQPLVFCFL